MTNKDGDISHLFLIVPLVFFAILLVALTVLVPLAGFITILVILIIAAIVSIAIWFDDQADY